MVEKQTAEEKAMVKEAKAVAKEQDEMDERVVIRSSYGSPKPLTRHEGFDYAREA